MKIISNLEAAGAEIREEKAAKISLGVFTDEEAETFKLMLEELEECIAEARARLTVH